MPGDFNDVLTGVGMRSGVIDRHSLINGAFSLHFRERGVSGKEIAVVCDESLRDPGSVRPAQAYNTDSATARRRRDGDDGVTGGEGYFRTEIRTVFENASPTLSVATPGTSATAR